MMLTADPKSVSIGNRKAYKRWLERIEADELPKSLIYEFCQAIAPMQYRSGRRSGRATTLLDYEGIDLCQRLQERMTNGDGGPKVNAQQYRQGVDWLVKYGVKRGLPRCYQGGGVIDYRDIVQFRWSDWHMDDRVYRPEYTAEFKNGAKFWYRPSPWSKDCEWCWA